ncbi:MAG TPA: ribokinase [Verrucomicrobiae bacterium]|nr:ribokinase [Verrucomicrobiae bacterium]
MKPNILVIGSSNTDMIAKVPRIPRPGETILGGQFTTASGGKGANQAVAAARAGGEVCFVGCVGNDVFGDQAIGGFIREKINISYLRRKRAASGVALICVATDGQNSIAVAPGANAQLLPADIKRAQSAFHEADILLLQLETPLPTVIAAIKQAAKADLPMILNPAPAQPLSDELLRCVSIITPNETEAQMLTGVKVANEAGAKRAAQALHRRGVKTVIITLGSRGAFVSNENIQELTPAFKTKAVDTTAAGDVFNGALAVGLAERLGLRAAVQFANAAAAISVTRLGAQPSAPKRKEITLQLQRSGRSR